MIVGFVNRMDQNVSKYRIGIRMKKRRWWSPFVWMVDVVLQGVMAMMNCFCGIINQQKALSVISSRVYCQRSSPLRNSSTPPARFKSAQNLNSGLAEWSCAVVITTARVLYRIKRWWLSASCSFSERCCQCNFSKIFKGRQIILDPCRNLKYAIRCLLWWPKTLPGAIWTQAYSKPLHYLRWGVFAQTVNGLKLLNDYAKTLHLRCLKGFWISLCWKTRQV